MPRNRRWRFESGQQHARDLTRLLMKRFAPGECRFFRGPGQVGRARRRHRLLQLAQELAHAACLDRLDLQTRQSDFQPAEQVEKLLALDRRRLCQHAVMPRHAVLADPVHPELGTCAEQERILKALSTQIA